ncbi:hypothetical protein EYF80_056483 [Liparis tanakae]|uniref:Secreted protein n=1 Tax=Liparis tanakae TaxID=230148 RepID=A0A4Z2EWN0_9TELE|nr:hypothetical protein EYF80_056483 [Liparis tanakae]
MKVVMMMILICVSFSSSSSPLVPTQRDSASLTFSICRRIVGIPARKILFLLFLLFFLLLLLFLLSAVTKASFSLLVTSVTSTSGFRRSVNGVSLKRLFVWPRDTMSLSLSRRRPIRGRETNNNNNVRRKHNQTPTNRLSYKWELLTRGASLAYACGWTQRVPVLTSEGGNKPNNGDSGVDSINAAQPDGGAPPCGPITRQTPSGAGS